MRIAYFDCFSGVSGDMTLGALLACGADVQALRDDLGCLGLPGWRLDVEPTSLNGIGATDVTVAMTDEPQHSRHLADIEAMIAGSALGGRVKERATRVFRRLAEAEARVHRTTPEQVHFHEVGAVDAIVDVVGVCAALDRLEVDAVCCSPLPMGHGTVGSAHGVIPVPAPATVELTTGVPVYGVDVEGELVTPTGAALVTTLADRFGPMPTMTIRAAGYGAGKKRFGNRPNLLRIVVGDAAEGAFASAPEVSVLETNVDDLSPQFYEVAMDRLFAAGALDVFLTPVQMKKGRPATLLTVLAPPDRVEALAGVLFAETTTLGVRETTMRRHCLDREWVTVETPYGPIRIKVGRWHGAERTASPEYEDVKAAAVAHGAPVKVVHLAALRAYGGQP